MKFYKLAIFAIVFFCALYSVNTAQAITSPTSISLTEVHAYQNVVETDDMLFIALYDIQYPTIPSETVNQAFLFRLLDDGTELGSTAPFPYVNSGYAPGMIALYFSAADVELGGLTWEDPNYEVRLQGNPSVFASPPVVINASIEWNSVLTTKVDLRNFVAGSAFAFEVAWAQYTDPDVDLIINQADGNIFTQDGENYFGNVIPNARLAIPSLFAGRTEIPVIIDRDFDYSYRDQLLTFWDTSSIGIALDGVASVFNTPRTLITTLGLIAFNVVVVMSLTKANPAAIQIAPLTTAIILPVGAYIGLTDMVFAALVAMFALVGTVFILYLRRG